MTKRVKGLVHLTEVQGDVSSVISHRVQVYTTHYTSVEVVVDQ